MNEEWTNEAACKNKDTEEFFDKNSMKDFCRAECPVRRECLRTALIEERHTEDRYVYGVFGGYPARARVNMRKRYGVKELVRRIDSGEDPTLEKAYEPFHQMLLEQLRKARASRRS